MLEGILGEEEVWMNVGVEGVEPLFSVIPVSLFQIDE